MHAADVVVLVAYLAGVVLLGAYFGQSQRTIQDYFVGGRDVPAWAIMGSIVATETSTVTFISIPGLAYLGDYTFLQLAFGYVLGRVVVAVVLIPGYFRGEVLTAYQLLGQRFGRTTRQLASAVFLATRNLADGFRLFATGLVLAALVGTGTALGRGAAATLPMLPPDIALLAASIVVIGVLTIVYTYAGGMTAVVWTDVAQLVIYLGGAVVAAVIALHHIPGGWAEVVSVAAPAHKFAVFDFTWDLTKGYTFWSGVIGGIFLTAATHGTDQLIVQRYLCARSERAARAALIWSGVLVFAQFVLFLVIGTLLYVFYTRYAPADVARFTLAGRVASDRIFPDFIAHYLPAGLVGLVLAAILAAAMSTLSSSLNSSAAAAMGDFYLARRPGAGDAALLRRSRVFTAGFGVIQIAAALVAIQLSQRVVDEVLAVASFTSGLILGLFLLGTLTSQVRERGALTGLAAGTIVMLVVRFATAISWQWYVLIGSMVTFTVGVLASTVLEGDGAS